jgi:hypothetical protein
VNAPLFWWAMPSTVRYWSRCSNFLALTYFKAMTGRSKTTTASSHLIIPM